MEAHEGERPTLTQFSPGAGCGCKLSSDELRSALGATVVPFPTTSGLLVGPATSDDAGVFALSEGLALVQTLDFFTPIVDDPSTWGAIAATNALSDVYAMGGRPITAMNIVAWPRDGLPWDLLAQVIDGASDVLGAAGCALVGGHSIDDAVPKFGCAITGLVDPAKMLTNAAGQVGDQLILTKPIGIGAITTARKRNLADVSQEAEAVAWMLRSNRLASEAAVAAGARCATDVTGFGLVGHLAEMAQASAVGAIITLEAVPVIGHARSLLAAGAVSGGTERNHLGTNNVDWGEAARNDQFLLCDAQTSGGLLIAAPPAVADTVLAGLGPDAAWMIGELTERSEQGPWLQIR